MKKGIAGRIVRDDLICLWTYKASIVELSLTNEYKEMLEQEYGVKIAQPLFFFNRIRAKVEGQGEGTLLMQEVVKILDEKGVAVINTINPYGGMNLAALIKFYKKYGFESVDDDGLMIRIPNV